MKKMLALCCLCCMLSPLFGEVVIQGDSKIAPGKMARLDVGGDIKFSDKTKVAWKVRPLTIGTDGKLIQADTERVGNRLLLTAPAGASFLVELRVIDFKQELFEEAEANVTVGDPGPGPKPPDPVPVDDPLTKSLKAAYALDADTDKPTKVAYLASVFKASGPLVDASPTFKDLFGKLKTAIHAPGVGLSDGAMPNTIKAVGTYLNSELSGKESAPLDKAKAKDVLGKVGTSLGGIK